MYDPKVMNGYCGDICSKPRLDKDVLFVLCNADVSEMDTLAYIPRDKRSMVKLMFFLKMANDDFLTCQL